MISKQCIESVLKTNLCIRPSLADKNYFRYGKEQNPGLRPQLIVVEVACSTAPRDLGEPQNFRCRRKYVLSIRPQFRNRETLQLYTNMLRKRGSARAIDFIVLLCGKSLCSSLDFGIFVATLFVNRHMSVYSYGMRIQNSIIDFELLDSLLRPSSLARAPKAQLACLAYMLLYLFKGILCDPFWVTCRYTDMRSALIATILGHLRHLCHHCGWLSSTGIRMFPTEVCCLDEQHIFCDSVHVSNTLNELDRILKNEILIHWPREWTSEDDCKIDER